MTEPMSNRELVNAADEWLGKHDDGSHCVAAELVEHLRNALSIYTTKQWEWETGSAGGKGFRRRVTAWEPDPPEMTHEGEQA